MPCYITYVLFTVKKRMNKICLNQLDGIKNILSYNVASGSEITPCNKIDKPLVVYRFTGNVMTSIHNDKIITFLRQK